MRNGESGLAGDTSDASETRISDGGPGLSYQAVPRFSRVAVACRAYLVVSPP